MALDSSRLQTAIEDKIVAVMGLEHIGGQWCVIAKAVADAVIEELQAHAVVSPGTLADSTTAVITGEGTLG